MIEDLFQPRHLLLILCLVFLIVPFARIFQKAGYSPWLCLAMLIPPVNVLLIFWLAFSRWPVETELERLRQQHQ